MSAFEPIPEQPEEISAGIVSRVLIGTVLAIVTCVVVVWALDAFQLAGGGRSEIQHVELVLPAQPFSELTDIEARRRQTHDELERWSWANRAEGRVHVPVSVAIDRYLELRGAR